MTEYFIDPIGGDLERVVEMKPDPALYLTRSRKGLHAAALRYSRNGRTVRDLEQLADAADDYEAALSATGKGERTQ